VPSGPTVILILKVAVIAVTVILLTSLVALARGNYRLHGRINLVFFALTMIAVLGLEGLVQFSDRTMFAYLLDDPVTRSMLYVHLCFSVPSAVVLIAMLFTGYKRKRDVHLFLAGVFVVLWIGTFITGIFYLPPALF
jgi:uncharacterized membrane protein YozB (DUF420 family)